MAIGSLSETDETEVVDDFNESTNEQVEPLDLSTDERKLVTQPYDLGVKGITSDIAEGRISLNIVYQRKYVWDSGKASRLIESLLLNVPIPVCYFAEDETGVYEVIDGLQRLQTILNYVNGEFALSGISVLGELEGKRFQDLAPRDRRRLENRTIRCIVITDDSHPDIKFDVFERLNTGAASLTAQELRNCVYRGQFNDYLKDLAIQPFFEEIVGSFSNKRMEREELILRFFALVDDLEAYKPPLRQFLNQYIRDHRKSAPSTQLVDLFEETCRTISKVFGTTPFKVPGSTLPVNRAFFDAVIVAIARSNQHEVLERAGQVNAIVAELLADERFKASIGRATADRQRMLYRVGIMAERLRGIGVTVDLPVGLGVEDLAVD